MSPAPSLARGKTGRRYIWPPGVDEPELVVPSVTTILNNMNKPALPNWAAKQVATYAVEHLSAWEDLPVNDAIDLLKRAPYRNMSSAGDRGTKVHEAVEAWINGDNEPTAPVIDDLDLLPYVAGAIQYMNDHVERVWYAEPQLFNRTYQYAGSADLIAELNTNKTAIIDWKTSKNVYAEHALQLVAYANAEFIAHEGDELSTTPKELALPEIQEAHIVHLPGNGTYKAYKVELTERAFRTFTALRTLQAWKDNYEADAYGLAFQGTAETA